MTTEHAHAKLLFSLLFLGPTVSACSVKDIAGTLDIDASVTGGASNAITGGTQANPVGGSSNGGSNSTGGNAPEGGHGSTGGVVGVGGSVPTGGSLNGGASSTGGSVPTGGSGGAGNCDCPNEPIVWGLDGGTRQQTQASLSCAGFSRTLTNDYQCDSAIDCSDWGPNLSAIKQALASADVQQALAQSPALYGVDNRPVDGVVMVVHVGDKQIQVGDACPTTGTGCTEAPSGVKALIQVLTIFNRRATATCSPECLPRAAANSASCAVSGQYYPVGAYSCQVMNGCSCQGPSCTAGFVSQLACEAQPAQCVGLYPACGGFAGDTCAADEYCAYQAQYGTCGWTDATAVCLPRPRSCPQQLSPVCGCDGIAYESACIAAMAGHGLNAPNYCNL